MDADPKTTFEGWVILELMGHRRLAGYLTEQTIGGVALLRINVPGADGFWVATQFYSGAAVYCITPTTEAIARKVAINSQPAPVTQWELEQPALPAGRTPAPADDEDAWAGEDD